ncbi:MAG: hypothetical protein IKU97_00690 [Tidjanibacter sp.]|nr:hypothetical protein [Tidjanibacter sp.]
MSEFEIQELQEKIDSGVRLAHKRLIEKTIREDGDLVVVQDGEVVHISGEELCCMQQAE